MHCTGPIHASLGLGHDASQRGGSMVIGAQKLQLVYRLHICNDLSSLEIVKREMDLLARSSTIARSEWARRAGVPRSTLYRALEGSVDVRLGTLHELAYAAGFEIDMSFRPTSDPEASDAARVLLGDAEAMHLTSQGIASWTERIERFAGDGGVEDILAEAGRASSLMFREGAIGMRGTFSADRLASCGYATGRDWALSGADSLEAMGVPVSTEGIHVLWTSQPKHAMQLLLDTGSVATHEHEVDLFICNPSALTLHGVVDLEGIRLVSPVQGMIDCMGLREYERDLARSVVEGWK